MISVGLKPFFILGKAVIPVSALPVWNPQGPVRCLHMHRTEPVE